MTTKANDIGWIARQGIALVQNDRLRAALDAVYTSPRAIKTVETAHRVFERLTSEKLSTRKLRQFVSGWRSTHGTALYVSGLIVRLHRKAREVDKGARALLYQAAAEIGEVICEDTGVDDVPHNERFERFANFIVGDDQWQLSRYSVPACMRFRNYVQQQRLTADIEDAILTTAASENWNTGEYTYFSHLIEHWAIEFPEEPETALDGPFAYVTVHAGETELGHFLHALKAWELYCVAVGLQADPRKAAHCLESYLDALRLAFDGLEQLLI
jgi:hypothetical protein